ncbi:MAG: putative sulfate exporter family transporter [Bacteroidetes bacterium]|nr:putative sulfate exporter family transporter [Bacteroidota bacterium]
MISVGTAICGGSAIAAISQVVEADEKIFLFQLEQYLF